MKDLREWSIISSGDKNYIIVDYDYENYEAELAEWTFEIGDKTALQIVENILYLKSEMFLDINQVKKMERLFEW